MILPLPQFNENLFSTKKKSPGCTAGVGPCAGIAGGLQLPGHVRGWGSKRTEIEECVIGPEDARGDGGAWGWRLEDHMASRAGTAWRARARHAHTWDFFDLNFKSKWLTHTSPPQGRFIPGAWLHAFNRPAVHTAISN